MSVHPIISVCIANYNGLGVINDCIDSVLAQLGDLSVEIIIHDDASTDDSVQHICAIYPKTILIGGSENVGFCIANNRMVERATGKYILLLNNDAALYSDALITLYKAAQGVGLPAILSLPQYDFDTGELLDIGSLVDPFLNPVPNMNPERGEVAMVMGACLWIPKSLWQELGGFPDWFGSIGEDLYLCSRARLAGYSVLALGVSGYRHRVGASFGGGKIFENKLSSTFRRRALSECNKTFAMIICYPNVLLVWLLPLHIGMLYLEGLLLTIVKGDSNVWHKIYAPLLLALWHQRHKLLTLRKIAQVQRKVSLRTLLATFVLIPWKWKMLIRHGFPNLT